MIPIRTIHATHIQRDRGVGIVEIIVGSAIITLTLLGIIATFHFHTQAGLKNTKKIQVAYLLEEGMEAVRFIRDSGWNTYFKPLSTSTPYYLYFNGVRWEATTTTQALIDGVFDRTVIFEDVYRRDSDSDIIASTSPDSKTFDPDSKYVRVRVSWIDLVSTSTATSTIETQTYLTNIFEI